MFFSWVSHIFSGKKVQLIILHLFFELATSMASCAACRLPRQESFRGEASEALPEWQVNQPISAKRTIHLGYDGRFLCFFGVFFGCVRYCKICRYGLSGWWLFCWTMALFAEIPVARRCRWSRGLSLRSAPRELVGNQVVGNQRACALDQFSGNFGYFGELSCLLFYGDFLGPENAGGTSWRRAMWQTRNFTTYMLSLPLWTGGCGGGSLERKAQQKQTFDGYGNDEIFFVVLDMFFWFHFKRSTTTGSIIKHLNFSLYQNIKMTILWVPNHETSSFFVEMTMSGSF